MIDRSRARVSLAPQRVKHVTVSIEAEPVLMGMHGAVAEHYRIPADQLEPHATTLDYIVGATAGCLSGTFGGRLAALGQPTDDEHFQVEAEGDIVNDDGVLRLAAIRVVYRIKRIEGVPESKIDRAHATHRRFCPVARSIGSSIDISTRIEYL